MGQLQDIVIRVDAMCFDARHETPMTVPSQPMAQNLPQVDAFPPRNGSSSESLWRRVLDSQTSPDTRFTTEKQMNA